MRLPLIQLERIEQRQLRHALGAVLADALQQIAPVPTQTLGSGRIEQCSGVGQDGAQPRVVLDRVQDQAVQQYLERGQQQHEQGHALLPCGGFQRLGEFRLQADIQACPGMTQLQRAWAVGRQLQHRLLVAQLLAPVVELARLLARRHPLALPGGIIGVLERQGRQSNGCAVSCATRACSASLATVSTGRSKSPAPWMRCQACSPS
ncbi:hypothetical protein WR25_12079 [Diploscapter pachys]|uniref:Uncharacterized protein n=1 Tax=Diploscapter pachys TaxID=2018661 RepID=A0A2A2KKY3_9BILA|nr:hypothetical protein WR25_12079 [Diploscapter pachys]